MLHHKRRKFLVCSHRSVALQTGVVQLQANELVVVFAPKRTILTRMRQLPCPLSPGIFLAPTVPMVSTCSTRKDIVCLRQTWRSRSRSCSRAVSSACLAASAASSSSFLRRTRSSSSHCAPEQTEATATDMVNKLRCQWDVCLDISTVPCFA